MPSRISCALLLALAVVQSLGQTAEQRRAETLKKADAIFGVRYSTSKPIYFDKDVYSGLSDAVRYPYGDDFVVEVYFAEDGSVPELDVVQRWRLETNSMPDTLRGISLPVGELKRFIAKANQVQPLGDALMQAEYPSGCFQSGANNYCTSLFENAIVAYYVREEQENKPLLQSIQIGYRHDLQGVIEQTRSGENDSIEVFIAGRWYSMDRDLARKFKKAIAKKQPIAASTFGCLPSARVCGLSLLPH